MNKVYSPLNEKKDNPYIKLLIQCIIALSMISILMIFINSIVNPILYKNIYSYKNIILYTANPIDSEEANNTLIEVDSRISNSTVYNEAEKYNVYFSNSKITRYMYFTIREKMPNIGIYIKSIFTDTNTDNIKVYSGYVLPIDPLGISYISTFDIKVIAHELTHQMLVKKIDNPILTLISVTKDSAIYEGYANLIADGIGPYFYDTMLDSTIGYSDTPTDHLHDDGNYHKCRLVTVTYKHADYYNPYGLENMYVVNTLLEKQNILDLLSNISNKNNIEKAKYDFFVSEGFEKIDNIGSVEGDWFKIECRE